MLVKFYAKCAFHPNLPGFVVVILLGFLPNSLHIYWIHPCWPLCKLWRHNTESNKSLPLKISCSSGGCREASRQRRYTVGVVQLWILSQGAAFREPTSQMVEKHSAFNWAVRKQKQETKSCCKQEGPGWVTGKWDLAFDHSVKSEV